MLVKTELLFALTKSTNRMNQCFGFQKMDRHIFMNNIFLKHFQKKQKFNLQFPYKSEADNVQPWQHVSVSDNIKPIFLLHFLETTF